MRQRFTTQRLMVLVAIVALLMYSLRDHTMVSPLALLASLIVVGVACAR